MKIEIEIPKEFEKHFTENKFKDSFERIMDDIKHSLQNGDVLCAGRYEYETVEMLLKAFEDSRQAYDIDKVVKELEELKDSFEGEVNFGTRELLKLVIEIVKQGFVADDCCEWKQSESFMAIRTYKIGCCDRTLDLTVRMSEEMKYCPYCGKKIKIKVVE